jgi:hypothetical protein
VAAAYGYSQILTLLLQYETHVEHLDYDLNTPLHMSCKFGHNECCRLLIYAGANLNCVNSDGDTPLHSSVRYKHAGRSCCMFHMQFFVNNHFVRLSQVVHRFCFMPMHRSSFETVDKKGRLTWPKVYLIRRLSISSCSVDVQRRQHRRLTMAKEQRRARRYH